MRYIVYADGACSNNGRQNAKIEGSFAVYEVTDNSQSFDHASLVGKDPFYFAPRITLLVPEGGRPTNNLAEALTLHTAITWLCGSGILSKPNDVTIYMDSQMVLYQMSGLYKTKNGSIREVYQRIHGLLAQQGKKAGCKMEDILHLDWIPGELMKSTVIGH